MRSTILTLLALMSSLGMSGQVFNIIDGFVYTCGGVLVDSGGEGGPGYGDNEDLWVTICSEFPGGSVTLDWPGFNLSTAGSAPGDQIIIYDGVYDGTPESAPELGTWAGTDNPGTISATFGNVTGCLTVRFISNETGTSSFAANISCIISCEPPTPVVTTPGITSFPALVCQGEEITFDATASTAGTGFNIVEYKWIFADGTVDSLSGATVTHAYTIPGAYTVRLILTDDNDCESTEAVGLQFLVSTTPDFSAALLVGDTICQGESVILNATGVAPVTWSGVPVVEFGEPLWIPDDQSQPFISDLEFTAFQAGSTLTSIDLLETICVSMEHSYMGDLELTISCPNGQTAMLHDQGGTNTFLGDPIDVEAQEGDPGICFDYCWSPTATNGTWVDNSFNGATPNTQPSTLSPGNSLIPGTYASFEPLEQLVGCPLNGVWQFVVRDLLGADDGNICGWSITFDESLYPDLTTYTPVLGTSTLDSASWSGPGITTDPATPLVAVATPTSEGWSNYTFSITDNFGCTYDTTVSIFVNPGIQAPVLITGDAQLCADGIAFLNAPAGYTSYQWSNGSFGQNITVSQGGTYIVTVFSGDCSLPSEPFTVTQLPSPTPVITGPGFSCGGAQATLATTSAYESYSWSNGSQTPTITVGTGTYSVTVQQEGCSGTSTPFVVTVGSDPQAAFTADPASPQPFGVTAEFVDGSVGNGSNVVSWNWDFGTQGAGSTEQSPEFTFDTPGTYPVTLTVTTADGCTSTITQPYVVLASQIIIPNVFTPNGDGNNDFFVIENGQYYVNTLAVYNRWGNPIFEANNYQNTWRAPDVPEGTYYYVFTTAIDGKEYTGHVTILH